MSSPFHSSPVNIRPGTKVKKGTPTSNGLLDAAAILSFNITAQKGVDVNNYTTTQGLTVTGDANGSIVGLGIQNKSSGAFATSDVIFYADGADAVNGPYLDIGIGSSLYNNPVYTIGGVAAYMFTYGENLAIGTGTANDLVQHAGGTLVANEITRHKSTGEFLVQNATALSAGGTAHSYIGTSSTAAMGIYWGSGAPTVSAAKGSLYLRSDGTGTGDRMYVNSSGSTTWTNVVTAA